MKIRTTKQIDAEGIAKASAVLGYDLPFTIDVSKQLAEIEASKNTSVWVCEIGSEIVGWVHAEKVMRLASKSFVGIVGIAVASESQNKGVGSRLVKQVTDWASSVDLNVRVRTNENRSQAINFYSKCGFTEIKRQQVLQWRNVRRP